MITLYKYFHFGEKSTNSMLVRTNGWKMNPAKWKLEIRLFYRLEKLSWEEVLDSISLFLHRDQMPFLKRDGQDSLLSTNYWIHITVGRG